MAVDFSRNVWQNWSDFAIEVSVQRSILPQFVSQKLSHLNRKLSQFRNALSSSFKLSRNEWNPIRSQRLITRAQGITHLKTLRDIVNLIYIINFLNCEYKTKRQKKGLLHNFISLFGRMKSSSMPFSSFNIFFQLMLRKEKRKQRLISYLP